ncbi:hypothetical protein ACFLU6_04395, partial [Acidobacteriota bacterium]
AGLAFVLTCHASWRWSIRGPVALFFLCLGLGSKETAVIFPLLAALTVPWRGSANRRCTVRILILTGMYSAAYGLLRVALIPMPGGYTQAPSRYLFKELLTRPFAALGMPLSGQLLANAPWMGALALSGLIVLLVLSIPVWQHRRETFMTSIRLALWVVVSILPVYGFFFVGSNLEGSRYIYLADAGWAMLLALMLATGLPYLVGRNWIPAALWCVFIVMSVGTTAFHLQAWREAGLVRDQVLASASQAALRCDRHSLHFIDLPDSVHGAYVFRNGFKEALERYDGTMQVAISDAPDGASCTYRWRGEGFERAESETPGTLAR